MSRAPVLHMTAAGRRKLEEALGTPITDADLARAGWTYEPRELGDGLPRGFETARP